MEKEREHGGDQQKAEKEQREPGYQGEKLTRGTRASKRGGNNQPRDCNCLVGRPLGKGPPHQRLTWEAYQERR